MNPFPFPFPAADLSEVNGSKLNWYYKRFVENFYNEYRLGHFLLAAYAAVPAFITPDLLYKLWQNFNRYNWNGTPVSIHRIAVSDLLLSPLCREVGYELYEMDYDIRMAFLEWLKKEGTTEIWKNRQVREINEVAKFVEDYHLLPNPAGKRWGAEYIETQTMEAVSYYNPTAVTDKLFNKLRTASTPPFRETELLHTIDMFIKTKNRLARIDSGLQLTDSEQKQVDWMHAWKALIEQNNKGFIERLNAQQDLYELFNDTQTGVEIEISKGMITQLNAFSDRKLRALVVSVDAKTDGKPLAEYLNSALLFAELIKELTPASSLELTVLTDINTTHRKILETWQQMVAAARPNDDLLFYISSSSIQEEGHCCVACDDPVYLRDEEIGNAAKSANCSSVTIFAQVDHAATPYWLDTSKPGHILFAACGYDQRASYLPLEADSKRYCEFTWSFVNSMQRNKTWLSNRSVFSNTLRQYEDSSWTPKKTRLLCNSEMYNRFFLRGNHLTAELQDLLRFNGYFDERSTGSWNKKTALALAEYIAAYDISDGMTKQEYIDHLQAGKEYFLQNAQPVFLVIFSNPNSELSELQLERRTITDILKNSGLMVEPVILIDCDRQTFVNTLKKREFRNRIQFVYYSGKDSNGDFLLKDGAFTLSDFVDLFDYQENIKLFVANTCRSHLFAEYTTQLGVGLSIGIEGEVDDTIAADFGIRIFELLTEGHYFIKDMDAFKQLLSRYNSSTHTYKLFTAPWVNAETKLGWPREVIAPKQPDTQSPEIYALIVGINSYLHPSLPLLEETRIDAVRLQEYILQENVKQENVQVLITTDTRQITQETIDYALLRLTTNVDRQSSRQRLLVIYFAGYGTDSPNGPLLLLPGWTPEFQNLCINIHSYITTLEDTAYFHGICCFYDLKKTYGINTAGLSPLFKLPLETAGRASTLTIGHIAGDLEEAYEGADKGPVFSRGALTKELIKGLNGGAANSDGNITFNTTRNYLRRRMGKQPSVQSTIKGNDDFIMATGKQLPPKKVEFRFAKDHLGKTIRVLNDKIVAEFITVQHSVSLSLELKPGIYILEITEIKLTRGFEIDTQDEPQLIDLSWQFLNKWIWVVGTASQLSEDEERTAKTVGKFIAEQGYGLITGGWPGVDYLVAEAYFNTLKSITDVENKEYLIQLVESGQEPDFKKGMIQSVPTKKQEDVARKKAFVVISIGGKGGPYKIFQYARAYNLPFIPLPHTGSDSERMYDELTNKFGPDNQGTYIDSFYMLREVIGDSYLKPLQNILDHLNNKPKDNQSDLPA